MTAPVFLAETSLGRFSPGDEYLLDGLEGRHAGVVQRKRAGERIDIVDGAGTRLECVVTAVDGPAVRLTVASVVHEPEPDIVLILVQALAKGDRDEMAVEAAVETGVDGIVPWQAERSVVIWRGERAAKSLVRWRATVRAAVKQSRRARVPPVSSAVTTAQLAALIQAAVSNNGVALVLHEDANVSLADVPLPSAAAVAAKEAARPADEVPVWADGPVQVVVIVGPEGGISDAELAALTQAGAVTVRLGPHVLRTSTAGPVAIALLSQRLGRWELS